jgi:hypothetical protein
VHHDDPQVNAGAVRAGDLMPRLFVQHVTLIGASLAFAFFRPASALDISAPHVVVPHINVPRPQINVPRPQINARPQIPTTLRLRAMSTLRGTTNLLRGNGTQEMNPWLGPQEYIREQTTPSVVGPSSRAPINPSFVNTSPGGPSAAYQTAPTEGGPAIQGSTSGAASRGSSAGYSGAASADSLSSGCGRKPARSCR